MLPSSYENIPGIEELYQEIERELKDKLDNLSKEIKLTKDGENKPISAGKPVKFRRVPVAAILTDSRDRMGSCNQDTGHILSIEADKIVCSRCPAEWKNEGF